MRKTVHKVSKSQLQYVRIFQINHPALHPKKKEKKKGKMEGKKAKELG